jgi:hypothetical protein
MGPQADQAAARAGARHAEPDEAYVVRLRAQHETSMQVSGLPAPRGPPAPGCAGTTPRTRHNVERAIAQVATCPGRRIKLRYRGVTKNNAWLKRRTAALNLRNLLGQGLTRHDRAWVLGT